MSAGPSKVYFGSVILGNTGRWAAFGAKVDEVVKKLNFKTIDKKDKVAIKMHLGFNDGYQTVPVFFVRRIVQAVKDAGGYPFSGVLVQRFLRQSRQAITPSRVICCRPDLAHL